MDRAASDSCSAAARLSVPVSRPNRFVNGAPLAAQEVSRGALAATPCGQSSREVHKGDSRPRLRPGAYTSLMPTCSSCDVELTTAPKFCPECGTRLESAIALTDESRRVVTILFSDVADSTA